MAVYWNIESVQETEVDRVMTTDGRWAPRRMSHFFATAKGEVCPFAGAVATWSALS